MPPRYLSRHSIWIPQPPFYTADLTAAILSSRRSAFSGYFTPGCLTVAMPPGYLNRHSIRIPQPLFYPADTPPPSGCLTAAIILGRSHSRHSIRPTPHLHPDVSQLPFYTTYLTAAILSVRRSAFSKYFTPGAFRRMGEESICGQRFTLHPNSLAR